MLRMAPETSRATNRPFRGVRMSMTRLLLLPFALAFWGAPAKAQNSEAQALTRRVEQLERRVAELERRLQTSTAACWSSLTQQRTPESPGVTSRQENHLRRMAGKTDRQETEITTFDVRDGHGELIPPHHHPPMQVDAHLAFQISFDKGRPGHSGAVIPYLRSACDHIEHKHFRLARTSALLTWRPAPWRHTARAVERSTAP